MTRVPPLAHRRALVRRHTRLREVPGVEELRLHLADEVDPVWRAAGAALGLAGDEAPIPFWAFAWAGGIALARWVLDHPAEVGGRRVLDLGAGSGLVGIAAARAGAERVTAADIDPFAEAAVALNARANGVHLGWARGDLLDSEPPEEVDVLLAADTWYEGPLAARVLPWLRAAAGRGIRVLVADPGRRYLPPPERAGLHELARFEVPTTTILEDRERVGARVWELRA